MASIFHTAVFFHHLRPAFTFFLHSGKFRVQPATERLVDGRKIWAMRIIDPQQWALRSDFRKHCEPISTNHFSTNKNLWSPALPWIAFQVARNIQQLPILAIVGYSGIGLIGSIGTSGPSDLHWLTSSNRTLALGAASPLTATRLAKEPGTLRTLWWLT